MHWNYLDKTTDAIPGDPGGMLPNAGWVGSRASLGTF